MLIAINSEQLWASFVSEILAILRVGLKRLALEGTLRGHPEVNELSLNRKLYDALWRATQERQRELQAGAPALGSSGMQITLPTPWLDANNQPSPDDLERSPREDKRPDFQWNICDSYASDHSRSRKSFVVECKRLREPSQGWKFNINYVEHGARRFTIETHVYGMDDLAGGMVGYVQSMELDAIWQQVSQQMATAGLTPLPMPHPQHPTEAVHASEHELARAFGRSPFRLHHIWVDLRQ